MQTMYAIVSWGKKKSGKKFSFSIHSTLLLFLRLKKHTSSVPRRSELRGKHPRASEGMSRGKFIKRAKACTLDVPHRRQRRCVCVPQGSLVCRSEIQ